MDCPATLNHPPPLLLNNSAYARPPLLPLRPRPHPYPHPAQWLLEEVYHARQAREGLIAAPWEPNEELNLDTFRPPDPKENSRSPFGRPGCCN